MLFFAKATTPLGSLYMSNGTECRPDYWFLEGKGENHLARDWLMPPFNNGSALFRGQGNLQIGNEYLLRRSPIGGKFKRVMTQKYSLAPGFDDGPSSPIEVRIVSRLRVLICGEERQRHQARLPSRVKVAQTP